MYIETHTIITFVLPDELQQACHFREDNDMTEWKESISTVAISFMRKQYYKAERKETEDAEISN